MSRLRQVLWPRTLHTRLLLLVSLVSLLAGVALAAYTIQVESRAALDNIRHQATVMARGVAATVVSPMLTDQLDLAEQELVREAAFPDVVSLHLTDAQGVILGHARSQPDGHAPKLIFERPGTRYPLPKPGEALQQSVNLDDGQHLVTWQAVEAGTPLGWVRLEMSLSAVDRLRAQVWQRTLAAMCLWLLGGGLLLWWALRGPMRALDEARQFAGQLAQAQGRQLVIDPHGPAETVELGRSLNEAALQLHRQSQTIAAALQQLQQQRTALQDANVQLSAIFALSPNGLVTLTAAGVVRFANPAFGRITGLDENQLLGCTRAELEQRLRPQLADAANWPGLAAYLESGQQAAEPRGQLLHLALPTPRVLAVLGRHARSHDHMGDDAVTDVLYLRDVTHETEVDRLKSEFLSTAAHELRTPIASIYGFAELMMVNDYPSERRKRMVETIHRNAQVLTHIVQDLLDLSSIEARGDAEFQRQALDLADVVAQQVQQHRPPPERQPPVWRPPSRAMPVWADAERLARVVNHLLSNAFKYSPPGTTVQVHGLLDTPAHGPQRVGFAVVDEGIGMTAEQVSRVFERFYRADTSGQLLGSGLGMSIVREIVRLHRGDVHIVSTPGRGTTVTVWLPLATEAPDAQALSTAVIEVG